MNTDRFKKYNFVFSLFTLSFVLWELLPELSGQGMFFDGITYSTISRNLSIGIGSYWKLRYQGADFFEHPPLMIWVQSLFFKVIGDYWFTEKLYSLIITAASILAIVLFWKTLFKSKPSSYFFWIPVILWYLSPLVQWSYQNNLLDTTMALFCLLAVMLIYQGLDRQQGYKMLLAGIFIAIALLTKGPVGVFPIAVPVIFHLTIRKLGYIALIRNHLLLIVPILVCFLILFSIEPSNQFITKYFNQQVLDSLSGNRERVASVFGRFEILTSLFLETLHMTGVVIIGLFLKKYLRYDIEKQDIRIFTFLLLIGLSASLPLMVSIKQRAFYLIPSMPYFALAFAVLIYPHIEAILSRIKYQSKRMTNGFILLGFLTIAIAIFYSGANFSRPIREKLLLEDISKISAAIPRNSTMALEGNNRENWTLLAYLERYLQVQFVKNDALYCDFLIGSNEDLEQHLLKNYHLMPVDTKTFKVYINKNSFRKE